MLTSERPSASAKARTLLTRVVPGLASPRRGELTVNALLDTAFSQRLAQRLIQGVFTGSTGSLIHA